MELNLSESSWHGKMYIMFYTKGLPQSLCPYFWKLVMSIILFIPMVVWYALTTVLYLIYYRKNFKYPVFFKRKDLIISTNLNTWTWIICFLIKLFLDKNFLVIILWIVLSVICVGIYFLISVYFSNKDKKVKIKKEHNPTLLKEFIMAKYYKYCPKINWHNKNQVIQ